MKRIMLMVCIMLCFSSLASAQISKTFDQFEGRITVESSKSTALNDFLDIKFVIRKCFTADQGFKDLGFSSIEIEMITKAPIPAPLLANEYYWMKHGEPYGHQEHFIKAYPASSRVGFISEGFKKVIVLNEEIMLKIPLLTAKEQYLKITPETLKEWNEL